MQSLVQIASLIMEKLSFNHFPISSLWEIFGAVLLSTCFSGKMRKLPIVFG